MPRGGKRQGAGRPRGTTKLHAMERHGIGAAASRRWYEVQKKAVREARDALMVDIDKVHAEPHAVPVAERSEWVRSSAGADHRDNVEFELRIAAEMAHDDDTPAPRLWTVVPKRREGGKTRVCEDIAAEWSQRLGREITPRMVRTCWEEVERVTKLDSVELERLSADL